MENTRETASEYGKNELAELIANGHGFELYQQYSEKQAASYVGVHPNTLKKARRSGQLAFLQKGERAIAYFGFQLADYLTINIQPCQNQQHENDSKLETTGFQSDKDETFGTERGLTTRPDKQNVYHLALETLKPQSKS